MKIGDFFGNSRYTRHIPRIVVTHLLVLALASVAFADSSIWTVLNTRDTGRPAYLDRFAAVMATGEIYFGALTSCPSPTLTLGTASPTSSCITKLDAAGRQVYAVQISGADVQGLLADTAGDAYILGYVGANTANFATTPGAYKTNPPGGPNPYVCKLSHTGGQPLYCTYVDLTIPGFAIDASSDVFLAGQCSDLPGLCVEKLNPTGTATSYRLSLSSYDLGSTRLIVDAGGSVFIASLYGDLLKLDATGALTATVSSGSTPLAMALAPSGDLQILTQEAPVTAPWRWRVRRYSSDLSKILFDKSLAIGKAPSLLDIQNGVAQMAIDGSGTTTILGATTGINLPVLHPTVACHLPQSGPALPFIARFDNAGNAAQTTYLDLPLNLPSGSVLVSTPTGASILYAATNWKLAQLGQSNSEISLSCIGNAGSFTLMPLSPNEIVTAFGSGIGPASPMSAQPDAAAKYPVDLGGIQVTFDGIAAPLLYADSSQINLVTPRSLAGKTTTHVCVGSRAGSTNCIDMDVLPAAPGIFSSGLLNSEGSPYAAAVNQDGTINSATNPAPVGSVLALFATGLGTVTPSVPDGGITPVPIPTQDFAVRVLYSSHDLPPLAVQTLYAGPAPLEVGGLGQINIVVPPKPLSTLFPDLSLWLEVTGSETGITSPGTTIWIK